MSARIWLCVSLFATIGAIIPPHNFIWIDIILGITAAFCLYQALSTLRIGD